jgi:tetratricopeptide (TPR) repeat protein
MTDWYRNTDWSPAIAEDFEARLARSRSQKAQYLSLQGMALVPKHPEVAASLLRRAIQLDDPFETVRALATLAQTHLALGNLEEALEAYEAALERQIAQPNIVSVQPADYLFAIGYFRAESRMPGALAIAEAMPDHGIFGTDPQILAAKAMVFDLAGRTAEARAAAARALPMFEGLGDAEGLGVNIAEVRERLNAIVDVAA